MDFFLKIHNGECGLGEHFCDHVRCHGPSSSVVIIQATSQNFSILP